jgi:hypothetical protein
MTSASAQGRHRRWPVDGAALLIEPAAPISALAACQFRPGYYCKSGGTSWQ